MDSKSSGLTFFHRDRATVIKKDNFVPELFDENFLPMWKNGVSF
jgi:hypothetical protein